MLARDWQRAAKGNAAAFGRALAHRRSMKRMGESAAVRTVMHGSGSAVSVGCVGPARPAVAAKPEKRFKRGRAPHYSRDSWPYAAE